MEEEVTSNNVILGIVAPIGTALVVAHSLAVINDWYRAFPWIDIPIHLGWAVVVGFVIYWVIERFPGHIDLGKNLFVTMLVGLSLAAFVGILWEFGEFIYDFVAQLFDLGAKSVQFSVGDTLADMLFDMLGGISVAIFAWLSYHKKRKSA